MKLIELSLISSILLRSGNGKNLRDSLTGVITGSNQIVSRNVSAEWTAHVIVPTGAEGHGEIRVERIFQVVTRNTDSICAIQVHTETSIWFNLIFFKKILAIKE